MDLPRIFIVCADDSLLWSVGRQKVDTKTSIRKKLLQNEISQILSWELSLLLFCIIWKVKNIVL